MISEFSTSRRAVIKAGAAAAVGLTLAAHLPALENGESAFIPSVFLGIEPDGTTVITISRSEMGQGVRTSLAMIIAEELDADWSKVKIVQAPADRKFGGQGTGGSGSVRGMYRNLRRVGATARHLLVAAAAQSWGVAAAECTTENGSVIHQGKRVNYGELASGAAGLPIPEESAVKLKDRKDFRIIGKSKKRVDNQDVVTGKAKYGCDAVIEGMKFAVVARPPAFGAKLLSFDASDSEKVPGVLMVKQMGDRGVFVLAENTWAALKGRAALTVQWDLGERKDLKTAKILADLREALPKHTVPPGVSVVSAEYSLPFLAHATMEPQNCTAKITGDHIEIWASTQSPEQAVTAAKSAAGVSSAHVNVMLLGGGFGRRLNQDYVYEAALIAKSSGHPVKVTWTRDDDMRNDGYRPATVHSLRGAVSEDGMAHFYSHAYAESGGGRPGSRAAAIPYVIEGATMSNAAVAHGIPFGFWRSVENSHFGFVIESFIDELAHETKADPVAFRLSMMRSDRLKACLTEVAKMAKWNEKRPAGSALGVGCFSGYGSHIAQVVEVTVKSGKVKVNKVWAAVDCGVCINPLGAEAQVQGATVDGISTALLASITIEKGGVVQKSFSDYPWLRMGETPLVEVKMLDSDADPGGLGEVGYPAVPAALTNAIFAATGKRIRDLPTGWNVPS